MTTNEKQEIELLNTLFKQLNIGIESKNSFIANYFTDIRNKVDISAEKSISKNNENVENKHKINENRKIILDKVNLFEKECLDNPKTITKDTETEKSVENFRAKLGKLNDPETSKKFEYIEMKHLERQFSEKLTEIKKNYLLNKSQVFIENTWDDIKFGKLVCVDNECLNDRCVRYLLK